MTNAVAAQIKAASLPSKLYVSIQVETAWAGCLRAVRRHRAGSQRLPVHGSDRPVELPLPRRIRGAESLPLDYYSRIRQGTALPVLVVEGGWASVSLDSIVSSPAEQARFFARQELLLDSARAQGVFQLTFYDLDTSNNPPPRDPFFLYSRISASPTARCIPSRARVWDSTLRRPHQAYPPD
jgi:hypothetical protein